MVADRELILAPLRALGIAPETVTDVVLSHHHPDHTVNIALFPNARIHDTWAVYLGDVWTDRPAEGAVLAAGVTLWSTPGHTPQEITTLVETDDGVVALTHLWWHAQMEGDPAPPISRPCRPHAPGSSRWPDTSSPVTGRSSR